MPLPHYTQLLMDGSPGGPGTTPYEPVYKNLFEITFVFPTILQAQGRDPILQLEEATSITLNVTPDITVKEQRFKYSTRAFMGTPERTHVTFDINFNVNVNQAGSMESWNTLKAWYDLVWNSQTGFVMYKADIIGTIIVNQHDKQGLILRRLTFQNAQITSIDAMDLNWEGSGDIWSTKSGFVADYWIDEYIDQNFTINPAYVSGY